MGIKFRVVERNNRVRAFRDSIDQLTGDPHVRVGIFADEKTGGDDRGGFTNVEIAAVHEYGAPGAGIPQRSFIRATLEQEKGKLRTTLRTLLRGVIEGKLPARKMFDTLGLSLVSAIQRRVRGPGVPPPLAPETIARKGSSRTLIDTGRMLAALTYATFIRGRKEAR